MKNKVNSLLSVFLLCSLFLLSGCGINSTVVGNVNTNQTVVELSEANFKIIDRVQGEATVKYVLGFGGHKEKAVNEMAMANLLSKTDLTGSKALVNVTTERHVEFKFFVTKVNVIVSANVVEFTD